MIVGAGSAEGALDAANIIKPALSRGELQCVGATTLNEYRKYIEKDAALERRFQTVKVEAPTVDEAVQILKGLRHARRTRHTTKPSLPTKRWKQLFGFPIDTLLGDSCRIRLSILWTKPALVRASIR